MDRQQIEEQIERRQRIEKVTTSGGDALMGDGKWRREERGTIVLMRTTSSSEVRIGEEKRGGENRD